MNLPHRLVPTALALTLTLGAGVAGAQSQAPAPAPVTPTMANAADAPVVTPEQRQFLDEWQQRCFRFFWEQADPATGLIADRAPADGSQRAWQQDEAKAVCSIGAVGFGLTAICIADERGWIGK